MGLVYGSNFQRKTVFSPNGVIAGNNEDIYSFSKFQAFCQVLF